VALSRGLKRKLSKQLETLSIIITNVKTWLFPPHSHSPKGQRGWESGSGLLEVIKDSQVVLDDEQVGNMHFAGTWKQVVWKYNVADSQSFEESERANITSDPNQ